VNPDEVVAIGAAIQAESLISEEQKLVLLDVTPLSLGIATYGGHFAKLIERNTTLPVRRAHVFTTTRDNQTAVKIRVLQGESDVAEEKRPARRVHPLRHPRSAEGRARGRGLVRHRHQRHRVGLGPRPRDRPRAVDHGERHRHAVGRRDPEDHRRQRALRGPVSRTEVGRELRSGSGRGRPDGSMCDREPDGLRSPSAGSASPSFLRTSSEELS
jgi:hypothetical protein